MVLVNKVMLHFGLSLALTNLVLLGQCFLLLIQSTTRIYLLEEVITSLF